MQRPWGKNVLSIFEKQHGAVSGRMCEMEVIRDMLKEVTEKPHHVGPCRPLQGFYTCTPSEIRSVLNKMAFSDLYSNTGFCVENRCYAMGRSIDTGRPVRRPPKSRK